MRAAMQVDLGGSRFALWGQENAVADALRQALAAHGAAEVEGAPPDMLVLSLPLLPQAGFDWAALRDRARDMGAAMAAHGPGGRILLLMSAVAVVPMRRCPDYSADMAAALVFARGLAMQLAPAVRVNALGLGAIGEDALIAGDSAMPGHAAVGRRGGLDEVCATALFLLDPLNSYLTGQILCVDGGWSVGYGRNF